MRRCKEKYFSELVYEGKRGCTSTLGRLAKVLGKVNGKGKEKPSSARRKVEWWLRLKEKVSMDGKDEMGSRRRRSQRRGSRSIKKARRTPWYVVLLMKVSLVL
jgi:hypothetical protein